MMMHLETLIEVTSKRVDEVSLESTMEDFLVGHGCLSLELLERLVVG